MSPHARFFLPILLFTLMATSAATAAPHAVKTAFNSPKDASCQATYKKLYGKGSANFRVVFGYKDTRPARFVGDRHERLAFVQKIMRPCANGEHACGFTRSATNADHFSKTVTGPNGSPVKILLTVTHSSASSDDTANRENPMQKWQSSQAKRAFQEGLEKADVVLYNGHSRFGGGPDFEPPRLTSKDEVDSAFYKNERPGFQSISEKLRARRRAEASGSGLKVLGLFSCASSQHFSDEITRETSAGLISSRSLIYYADALENSIAAVSALVEMRCESDFKRAMREELPVRGSKVERLFPRRST